jgi:hypothetical protein
MNIGDPLAPVADHELGITELLTVDPNLIELPNLPSYIISPS